jgi:hypothetical protein
MTAKARDDSVPGSPEAVECRRDGVCGNGNIAVQTISYSGTSRPRSSRHPVVHAEENNVLAEENNVQWEEHNAYVGRR